MKNIFLVLFVISIYSCGQENDYSQLIQGTWQFTHFELSNPEPWQDSMPIPTEELRFTDSSFFIDKRQTYAHSYIARWSIDSSKLSIIYSEILGTDTMEYDIIKLNAEQLILRDEEKTMQLRKLPATIDD